MVGVGLEMMMAYRPNKHRSIRWGWLVCIAMLAATGSSDRGAAQDAALQQAVNYVFTGRVDPPVAPEITDRNACIVVLPDRRNNRHVRYYLKRFNVDSAWFSKRYSGRDVLYTLEVEGPDTIVEYLTADKSRVSYGFKSTNIPLTGDVDLTKKALERIASLCPPERPKAPF
jgi:hypothetical protein